MSPHGGVSAGGILTLLGLERSAVCVDTRGNLQSVFNFSEFCSLTFAGMCFFFVCTVMVQLLPGRGHTGSRSPALSWHHIQVSIALLSLSPSMCVRVCKEGRGWECVEWVCDWCSGKLKAGANYF